MNMQKAKIVVRRSLDRGHANHGWLDSYHTFSFASYHDSSFAGYRSLRVLNEDRVDPSEGFGTHGNYSLLHTYGKARSSNSLIGHANYEIFSYVLSGYLQHKDSLGNVEVLKRGDVPFTSAGTGIKHSEFNHSSTEPVHFLQMWVKPDTQGLTPNYQTQTFADSDKLNKLCLFVAPKKAEDSTDTIKINQDVRAYASLLEKEKEIEFAANPSRYYYVHVAATGGKIKVNDVSLESGDGAFIEEATQLRIVGESDSAAEFLLFDLA